MTQEPYASSTLGVLGRRQRLFPPRPGRYRPPHSPLSQHGHDPHPRARLLAQPGLLLHRAAQSRLTQRLHRPRPVQDRLTVFEQRYNATAQPFKWKFTPTDLEDLLARIERHEQKERNQQHE